MFNKKAFLSLTLLLTLIVSSVVTFAEDTVTIDIYSFNDFHGALAESGKNVGMAKLVGAVNELRAENPNTIVVSAGDHYQGSAMSNLTYGAPVSDMLELLGVSVSAIGNHEFDWGLDRIATWSEDADLTFLASNIYEKSTDQPVSWAEPYVIQEVAGKKIAFIGLTTVETAYKTKAENVESLVFKDPVESAQVWVDYLLAGNDEMGVPDAIIALTHIPASQEGYGADITLPVTGEEIEAITNVAGIDGVVAAHNHATVAGYANDTPVVEAYYNGRALGHLQLTFEGDALTVTPSVDELYKRSEEIVPDETALAVYNTWNEELAPTLNTVVGVAAGELTHDRYEGYSTTVLGQWVCDVMAEKAGVQIAIQNGGGLRRSIPEGDITYGIMYEVMPFDNTLVTMDLTGEDLLKNIEHGIGNEDIGNASFSGLDVIIDMDQPFGERVVSMTLSDGTPIEMDGVYSVVVNDFMYPTGDNFDFTNATNVVNTYIPVRDVLIEAAQEQGTVVAEKVLNAVDCDAYTVVSGDVLWKIAQNYDMTYQELAELNHLNNANFIYVNQVLWVPAQ